MRSAECIGRGAFPTGGKISHQAEYFSKTKVKKYIYGFEEVETFRMLYLQVCERSTHFVYRYTIDVASRRSLEYVYCSFSRKIRAPDGAVTIVEPGHMSSLAIIWIRRMLSAQPGGDEALRHIKYVRSVHGLRSMDQTEQEAAFFWKQTVAKRSCFCRREGGSLLSMLTAADHSPAV